MKYEKDYVYKKKSEYVELSLKDWIVKSLEDGVLYSLFTAEDNEELFEEFLEIIPEFEDDDVNGNNLKEINENSQEKLGFSFALCIRFIFYIYTARRFVYNNSTRNRVSLC